MNNPTTPAGSQFTAPFNILPDIVYTNPTNKYSAQFVTQLDIVNTAIPNPTSPASSQFNNNFDLPGPNQQFFIDNNPTTNQSQFFDRQSQPAAGYYGNPTTLPQISTTQLTGLPNITGASGVGVTVQPQAPGALSLFGLTVTTQTSPQFQPQPEIANWRPPTEYTHTNVNLKTTAGNVFGFASLAAGSILGIPQIGQVGQSIFDGNSLSGTYTTLPLDKLTNNIFKNAPSPVLYSDFRSRINIDQSSANNFAQQSLAFLTSRRLDGFSAATRGSIKAGIYSAAVVTPVGPYSIFNLDGFGNTGYGWGEHDHPDAIRKDFTMRSHVAKRWTFNPAVVTSEYTDRDEAGNVLNHTLQIQPAGEFKNTINPLELATPFRGDKVNVIDFGKRKLSDAYLWNPIAGSTKLGAIISKLGLTQDFIKFYFTGPKLQAGNTTAEDDIIVFRAVLTTLSDSFSPSWNPAYMIGRADPNYIYNGYTRDLSVNFDVYATDRDEMQSIYRKLNALAGYTAPTYNTDSIAMQAPWMRITIGDLFNQTPVVLNSLSYDYDVTEAPWEINIEDDPNMMQVPFKIGVSCTFNVISDFLPQNGGRFYTLAKQFALDGTPIAGNDNWLSDSKQNISIAEVARKFRTAKGKVVGISKKSVKKTESTTDAFLLNVDPKMNPGQFYPNAVVGDQSGLINLGNN